MARKKNYSQYNKATKQFVKETKKMAKKNPKGLIITVCILAVVAAAAIGGYIFFKDANPTTDMHLVGSTVTSLTLNGDGYVEQGAKAYYNGEDVSREITTSYYKKVNETDRIPVSNITVDQLATFFVDYHIEYKKFTNTLTRTVNIVECDGINIEFLELGTWQTGDSTYIKAGNVDILIDAGVTTAAPRIVDHLRQPGKIDDGKIEYLIVTHSHDDHYGGIIATDGIFDSFTVENIIDFPKSTKSPTSGNYKKYLTKRDKQVAGGAKVLDVIKMLANKTNTIEIASNITMTILDQRYYHETATTDNNYSVCTLITQLNNSYLFTGDLEEDGEASLVKLNNLPKCTLFKGGHHGSRTSNTDALLSVIQPEVVCICCCAGSNEYTDTKNNMFPYQVTIDRLAKYTEKIYVTTVSTDNEKRTFASLNGDILFSCKSGTTYTVTGSNNSLILKESEWFKKNRKWPTT